MLKIILGLLEVINCKILLVTLFFVLWDVITGCVSAAVTNTWKSSLMREGGVHKLGTVMTIAFMVTLDIAQSVCDIGVNIPLTSLTCTFIIAMEIGSSWENLGRIWPELTRLTFINKTVQEITSKEGLDDNKPGSQ